MVAANPLLHVRPADPGGQHSGEHAMTSTFDTNTRGRSGIAAKRVSTAFAQRLIILALALGAILLGLSAPVVHAGPDDGPGTEPGPPYVPSGRGAPGR